MKIELKKLELHNFKGAKDQVIDFGSQTEIRGANATGKTRIVDAWSWLLFGKDSDDKKDFNIKALDKDNNPLHRTDHTVKGILAIDGMDEKLERIYREKWIKKRGEETPEFNGHETLFFVNGVPHQQKEYQDKIEAILPENLFKQITNPNYFNSMKWTERREMLFKIAGDVNDKDVIAANADLKSFLFLFNGKNFEQYKRELAAHKKLLKDTIQDIPSRIDEVTRSIVEDPDYEAIEIKIKQHSARLHQIEGLLQSAAERYDSLNQTNQDRQNQIFGLKRKIQDMRFDDLSKAEEQTHELKVKKTSLESAIIQTNFEIISIANEISAKETEKARLQAENKKLREEWMEINKMTINFNENEFICPACKRSFASDDIDAKKAEMTANFNNAKTSKLDSISKTGKNNAADVEQITKDIDRLKKRQEKLVLDKIVKQEELDAIIIPEVATIPPNPLIKKIEKDIAIIQTEIKPIGRADNSELLAEKDIINTELNELKEQLHIKEDNEKHRIRLQELTDQEKSLAQQIADLEKQEFQCEKFTRAKIDMIEDKVNSMFSLVKFKLFDKLINGGIEETCECLLKGVPFNDVNGAGKIQAGLAIIRTLSRFYDCFAPVWIDNRESTTDIPDMDCQVISLYVDPTYKDLKVETL